jgi:2TM domain-containing protein
VLHVSDLTLNDYQRAERTFEASRARIGFAVHAVITVLVSAALIAINVIVAPEFPWSPFPVVGMSIGLGFHYYFGIRRIDRSVAGKQAQIETFARRVA